MQFVVLIIKLKYRGKTHRLSLDPEIQSTL